MREVDKEGLESWIFWEGLGETIARAGKWSGEGKEENTKMRNRGYKEKSYLKFVVVTGADGFTQVTENCRCSICRANSEIKLLLVLNSGSLQLPGETKC